MTPEVKRNIIQLVKEYGTGRDTLRCLALGTIDNPPNPKDLDLSDSTKFVNYEVKNNVCDQIKLTSNALKCLYLLSLLLLFEQCMLSIVV